MISSAKQYAPRHGLDGRDVRRLTIHIRNVLICKEIASWAVRDTLVVVADQLLLLGVDRDHGLPCGECGLDFRAGSTG